MTEEEELELLELEALEKGWDIPEPEPEQQEMGLMDKVRGVGQELLGGQLVGFADEAIGAVRSGLDNLVTTDVEEQAAALEGGPVEQGSRDFYTGQEREFRDQFREEAPVLSTVANFVGGIASPINKVAPGLGATGGTAARTAQSVARGGAEGALAGFAEGEGGFQDRLVVQRRERRQAPYYLVH